MARGKEGQALNRGEKMGKNGDICNNVSNKNEEKRALNKNFKRLNMPPPKKILKYLLSCPLL